MRYYGGLRGRESRKKVGLKERRLLKGMRQRKLMTAEGMGTKELKGLRGQVCETVPKRNQ